MYEKYKSRIKNNVTKGDPRSVIDLSVNVIGCTD